MARKTGAHPVRKWLLRVMAILSTLVLAAVFYVAVVMGQPQADDTEQVDQTQPVLTASPAVSITGLAELEGLVRDFPVPVLLSAGSGGLTLTQAVSYDRAFEDGYARVLHLVYLSEEGLQLEVDSIYPARALSLLESGYHLSAMAGHSVAGMSSIRMESDTAIRLHAQSSTGLYTVTLPKEADGSIAALLRSLTLMQVE